MTGYFYEIEFVGRGGQGAKTAAELVGKIALSKGKQIQCFPDYGPERKGAPVRAFARISDAPIRICGAQCETDVLVIIDPTLLCLNGTLFNASTVKTIIINTSKSIEQVKQELGNPKLEIHVVDATTIALETMKMNITNSAMLGAVGKITNLFTLEEIKEEFRKEFEKKLSQEGIKANYTAIERAYKEVK